MHEYICLHIQGLSIDLEIGKNIKLVTIVCNYVLMLGYLKWVESFVQNQLLKMYTLSTFTQ